MIYNDLVKATEYMWGEDAQVFYTKVDGIYHSATARHGGYLVDIDLHPELKKYGEKTNITNIRAFEEDYEALKVLWLFPELINNIKESDKWLTRENVTKYEKNNDFIKDFPIRKGKVGNCKNENEITKVELLNEVKEMINHNIVCYSSDYSLAKAKQGYENEFVRENKKLALLEKMIKEEEQKIKKKDREER